MRGYPTTIALEILVSQVPESGPGAPGVLVFFNFSKAETL
jgi:hypothetical protein